MNEEISISDHVSLGLKVKQVLGGVNKTSRRVFIVCCLQSLNLCKRRLDFVVYLTLKNTR
jgi:hypothetical protein